MTGMLIIIACLVAAPTQCQTITTGVTIDVAADADACAVIAESWLHVKLDDSWFVKRSTCDGDLLEEDD